MADLNKVQLIGRLGGDPDCKLIGAGTAVANFSVATSARWKDKQGQIQERTEWHRVQAWGKLAELCQKYLHKGHRVYIEGELRNRSWDKPDGSKGYATEVYLQNIIFLQDRPKETGASEEEVDSIRDQFQMNPPSGLPDSEIPF